MAATFMLVTECPTDAATIFDLSLDIDAHVDSMSQSRERAIAGVMSGRIGIGQTVTWRARHFGIWFTMTSKISTLDRPRRFIDEQVNGPFKTFAHEHAFEDASGGYRMIDTLTVASPIFGALAERLVLVPYLRRLIQKRSAALIRNVG
ncbi:SRPBCC family protein [Microbacterium sp.]|uniref:SRPBCC family protein n=1 Tax=Microbacterium sp. TaxID=51671 RepID=UPI003A847C8D